VSGQSTVTPATDEVLSLNEMRQALHEAMDVTQ